MLLQASGSHIPGILCAPHQEHIGICNEKHQNHRNQAIERDPRVPLIVMYHKSWFVCRLSNLYLHYVSYAECDVSSPVHRVATCPALKGPLVLLVLVKFVVVIVVMAMVIQFATHTKCFPRLRRNDIKGSDDSRG